jgi:hypothetical protein
MESKGQSPLGPLGPCPSIVVFASPPVALLAAMELFRFESGLILSALSVSHWLGWSHYLGDADDASNFKEEGGGKWAVGLQFAHAIFLFLGRFTRNHLLSWADQQLMKFCITQIHVGGLLPGFVRLNDQRLWTLGSVAGGA